MLTLRARGGERSQIRRGPHTETTMNGPSEHLAVCALERRAAEGSATLIPRACFQAALANSGWPYRPPAVSDLAPNCRVPSKAKHVLESQTDLSVHRGAVLEI